MASQSDTQLVKSSALLTRAEFWSHTNNDNKNKDTGVYVYVNGGATALAQIENADDSEKDPTEYKNGSDHTIALTLLSPGSTKDECQNFTVRVKQKPAGEDTWKFNARVTLWFSDGTNLQKTMDGLVLENAGAEDHF